VNVWLPRNADCDTNGGVAAVVRDSADDLVGAVTLQAPPADDRCPRMR